MTFTVVNTSSGPEVYVNGELRTGALTVDRLPDFIGKISVYVSNELIGDVSTSDYDAVMAGTLSHAEGITVRRIGAEEHEDLMRGASNVRTAICDSAPVELIETVLKGANKT